MSVVVLVLGLGFVRSRSSVIMHGAKISPFYGTYSLVEIVLTLCYSKKNWVRIF